MHILSPVDDHNDQTHNPGQIQTVIRPKTQESTKIQRPSFYKVILLNDDFTPMDFVIEVLKKFFGKVDPEATQIMLQVHQLGKGIAGVFTFELAETKVLLVNSYAQKHKHPLKCIMEKDSSPIENENN